MTETVNFNPWNFNPLVFALIAAVVWKKKGDESTSRPGSNL